jgi:hypothetical protein
MLFALADGILTIQIREVAKHPGNRKPFVRGAS